MFSNHPALRAPLQRRGIVAIQSADYARSQKAGRADSPPLEEWAFVLRRSDLEELAVKVFADGRG